jgi:23S rRNA (uracil1939-C5)-methyltransferase
VHEALRRLGRLDGFELEQPLPASGQWRYRNKLEYSFAMQADEPGAERLICGFHEAAGARGVAAIEDCLLASERGNEARELALGWCRAQGLEAWDRGHVGARSSEAGRDPRSERTAPGPDGRARLRNLVVREGRRSGALQVRLVSTEGELDAGSLAQTLAGKLPDTLSGVLWTRTRSLAETTAGGHTELVWGSAELPERLGELDLRISAEAFFQTNTEMAEVLYGAVVEYAALGGWERVYDLYSGIGTIALTLAPFAGELWGIELIEDAVADAIAGARRNEIAAHFFAGDTRLALPELLGRAGRPDLVVVDPPRAGLSKKVVHRVIDAAPKRIVYVSCNPTTLAPNAAELVEAGWSLRKVRPVDMFPHTHHIECVALFERADGRPGSASSVA